MSIPSTSTLIDLLRTSSNPAPSTSPNPEVEIEKALRLQLQQELDGTPVVPEAHHMLLQKFGLAPNKYTIDEDRVLRRARAKEMKEHE